jgi:cobalt-zinc-cadmium efflux system membrane fusion protein
MIKKIIVIFLSLILISGCNNKNDEVQNLEGTMELREDHGSHGGKFFEADDGFGVEVTIYEPDIPPQSRVYFFQDGEQIDPALVSLTMELHRIDRVDIFKYKKQEDYLLGDIIVEEPHSFDVKITANYNNKEYKISYPSYEGRTTLSDEAIQSTGIETEKVQGGKIKTTVTLSGKIIPHMLKVAKLSARFTGIIKELKKLPGEKVLSGEVLAQIESNQSLKTYSLLAPYSGEVLDLDASVGEQVSENTVIMTVGDLSTVSIELNVPRNDFSLLKTGQKILVSVGSEENPQHLEGVITFLSALADGDSQTRYARAEIPNPKYELIPNLFVDLKVVIAERDLPVVIRKEALQKFRDWDVVFKKVGSTFEIAILELGQEDGDLIEVISGLNPNDEYVVKNSFVVKADVMKSGATHDH